MGPEYLIMKNGEKGAILFSENDKFECTSYPVNKVVDPTGAGDSFAGALAGYLASENSQPCKDLLNVFQIFQRADVLRL